MEQEVLSEWLPPYALDLLSTAIDLSGFPMLIAEEPGIGYDDVLALAGPSRPFHKLTYVPAFRDHRLHFVVNACYKIQRVFDQPPEQRLVPVGNAHRRLPAEDETELRERNPLIPPAAIPELSTLLYQGLIRQVVSMPFDIRVERDIAETLPDHSEAQYRYLERQVEDLKPHFNPRIAAFTPPRVYAAITAMNVVLADEAAVLTGAAVGPVFRAAAHREVADRLREELERIQEPGHVGDRLLTDRWAEVLGVRECYEWVRLDSVS